MKLIKVIVGVLLVAGGLVASYASIEPSQVGTLISEAEAAHITGGNECSGASSGTACTGGGGCSATSTFYTPQNPSDPNVNLCGNTTCGCTGYCGSAYNDTPSCTGSSK